MNSIYSHVYLDLQHKAIEPVTLKQYDYEARSVLFHITDNGSPYLLTDDLLAEVKIHKPDGTKVIARGNVHVGSNEITVNVSRQMTAVHGVLRADITLFREDRLLSTMPFHIYVEKCPIQNGDIDSADEYTLLEDLIALTRKNEAQRQANEQSRVQEEQTRTQNEQTRKQNEHTRIQNEQTRIQDEQARTQNEQARIRDEQARTQNEQTRIQQEQARTQNEQTRIQEEQARMQREADQRERINTLVSDVRSVARDTADAAADLQHKLDVHHFLLQEDKSAAGGVAALDANGKIPDGELYGASTSRKGITQLTDSVTSSSTTTAATPNSVRTVYNALVEADRQKHTHGNKSVLDGITADTVGKWNAAAGRTDTWRGIQDNLTSTSAVDSLSANQGRVLKEMIDNKLSASVPWSKVTGKPGSYPPSAHTHDDRYYTEAEVNSLLGGKAGSSHTHDDRYYTEAEINTILAMGLETESANNVSVNRGENLLLCHRVKKTGIYLVAGNVRPKDNVDGTLNIFVNNVASPVYVEHWVWTNGTPRIACCNHVQTTGFFHAAEGSYIILGMWSSIQAIMEGIRLYIMCLRTG